MDIFEHLSLTMTYNSYILSNVLVHLFVVQLNLWLVHVWGTYAVKIHRIIPKTAVHLLSWGAVMPLTIMKLIMIWWLLKYVEYVSANEPLYYSLK